MLYNTFNASTRHCGAAVHATTSSWRHEPKLVSTTLWSTSRRKDGNLRTLRYKNLPGTVLRKEVWNCVKSSSFISAHSLCLDMPARDKGGGGGRYKCVSNVYTILFCVILTKASKVNVLVRRCTREGDREREKRITISERPNSCTRRLCNTKWEQPGS